MTLSVWHGDSLITLARPTMRAALAQVAERYGTTPEALKAAKNKHKITPMRDEAMYLMRQLNKSYPQIAAHMGLSDHTSVMAAVRRHERRMAAQ